MWFFLAQTLAVLCIAAALGMVAGWLIWGGQRQARTNFGTALANVGGAASPGTAPSAGAPQELSSDAAVNATVLGVPTAPAPQQATEVPDTATLSSAAEVAALGKVAELQADIDRLRRKLRMAVTEIEVRTLRVEELNKALDARDTELGELRSELSQRDAQILELEAEVTHHEERAEAAPALGIAAAGQPQAPASPDPRAIEAIVASRVEEELVKRAEVASAELAGQIEGDRARLAAREAALQERVDEAERRVTEARSHSAQLEAELEELRSTNERLVTESRLRVEELELDLASARLRTDAATKELARFSAEILTLRESNAQHLQATHASMRDLQARLDNAKGVLSGRSITLPTMEPEESDGGVGLLVLPGMTREVADHLVEIGVGSLQDVASWSPDDVARVQSWLPEHPGIIERYGWVAAARETLRTSTSEHVD